MNSKYLYWLNMSLAILDNATLASAEISTKMTHEQITAILMGLLVSGGMMIPGNIPNIISAGKLKIKSKQWIALGVPLGMIAMLAYFFVIFYL
jgi:predicted cation transporter